MSKMSLEKIQMQEEIEDAESKQLCELLDSALEDFGKDNANLNDDDLDEYMLAYDAEAQRKAAERFEEIINDNGDAKQSCFRPNPAFSDTESLRFLSEMLMGKEGSSNCSSANTFLRPDGKIGEDFNAGEKQAIDSLLSHFSGNGSTDNASIDGLMECMIKAAVSKEVMYGSVKELHEKYSYYLDEKKQELENGDLENAVRYNKQFELLGLLKREYEQGGDDLATCSQNSAADENSAGCSKFMPPPTSITQNPRATRIAGYWLEMQKLGMPPPELQIESESADGNGDVYQKDGCSIM